MNQDNHKKTVIDHTLEQSANGPVPPEVEARLRARLVGLRQKIEGEAGSRRSQSRHWILRSAVSAAAVIGLGFAVWLSSAPAITLADMHAAVEKQRWVRVVFDNGEERWASLVDHKSYLKNNEGYVWFGDYVTNVRLDYRPYSESIHKSRLMMLPPDTDASIVLNGAPKTALDFAGIGTLLDIPEGETTEENKQLKVYAERHSEVVDDQRLIRFDFYVRDVLDRRLLSRQVWADPQTRLPVRVRQRLQLGARQTPEDEYTDGRYDFPDVGPADIYALGVPKDAPIIDNNAPTPADIETVIKTATASRLNWPRRFRVMQWPADKASANRSGEVDIIWWDGVPAKIPGQSMSHQGVKVSMQRFFNLDPQWNEKNRLYYLPVPATAKQVLVWIDGQVPVNLNISDGTHAYTRHGPSHPMINNPTPTTVQVRPVRSVLLFNRSNWPTAYLWPFADSQPPTQLIADADGAEPGTVVLRSENGTRRQDYHLDPAHDLICLKEVWWQKRESEWVKTREYGLMELAQLPGGQWYATSRKFVAYADPTRGTSGSQVIWNVDVTVLDEGEFPPDVFDGKKMLKEAKAGGAKVETQ